MVKFWRDRGQAWLHYVKFSLHHHYYLGNEAYHQCKESPRNPISETVKVRQCRWIGHVLRSKKDNNCQPALAAIRRLHEGELLRLNKKSQLVKLESFRAESQRPKWMADTRPCAPLTAAKRMSEWIICIHYVKFTKKTKKKWILSTGVLVQEQCFKSKETYPNTLLWREVCTQTVDPNHYPGI